MAVRPLIPFACLLTLAACSHPTSPTPSGAQKASSTYYVSTAGSNANSCATATSAVAANAKASFAQAIGCMTVVGDILRVHAGVYVDYIQSNMFSISGVSWATGQFQTVQDAGDGQVIIRPASRPPTGQVLHMSASDVINYILFKNLTFDGMNLPNTDFGGFTLFMDGDNLKFDTVEVINGTFGGIAAFGSHNQYLNMHVHRNGNDLGEGGHAAEGIYMTGSYNTIIGGEYDNNECNAIRLWASPSADGIRHQKAHDNLVSGVTIHDNGFGHAQLRSGLSDCRTGGGAFSVGDYNNTIINNVVYNGYWGWDDTFAQATGETGGNLVENNTIYNVDYCCNLYSSHTTFRDNTIYQVATGVRINNAGTGNTVENNQFADPHP